MRLVKYTCPNCKAVLKPYSVPTYSFGDPRSKCPECRGTYIALHMEEWDFLNPFRKGHRIFSLYFMMLVGPFVLSVFLTFVIVIGVSIGAEMIGKDIGEGKPLAFGSLILMFIFGVWVFKGDHKGFWDSVRESQARTANETYRKEVGEIFKRRP